MKFKISLIILALAIFISVIVAAAYRLQASSTSSASLSSNTSEEATSAPITVGIPASEAQAPAAEMKSPTQPVTTQATQATRPDEREIQRLKGSWGGEFKFETDPEWILLIADFAPGTAGLNVQVAFPLSDDGLAVSSPVHLETVNDVTTLSFEIPFQRSGNQNTLTFAGHLQDDKIVGEVIYGQERGVFELAPLADFAPDIYESRT